ncbi:CXADR-like membrane protein isoform X1 [Lates calcarifer]|uniref:CXADR-like membrane protein isoform X1 n=1 Tax=Lates calcarifer TaxID=8187 RepID=A0AAJ8AY51_LATCA|nr:CXADR-like membrane protein isoform X1 [Lates calcarifer]
MRHFGRLIWIVIYGISTVSCQVKVEGFISDSVLLPCIYREGPLPDQFNVHWRDKDDKIVLDINNRVQDLTTQDQVFKGRVRSFPDEYKAGNFTVVLEQARQSDSGIYECHVPKVDFQRRVQLTVAGVKPTPSPGPRVGDGAVTLSSSVLPLLSAPVFLFWL